MPHPQSSPRGYFAKKRIDVGTSQFTFNSTALLLDDGVRLNGQANGLLTANSTGVIFAGAAFISNQTTIGKLSANSTSLTLPGNWKMTGSHANAIFTANSTGIKIGTKYISTNTTGTTL
jgi:nitrous oxidase accessory protein NosD